MQIVKPVEKISKLSSEQSQHISISKLSDKFYKKVSHLFKKFGIIATQCTESLLGNAAKELFWVDLKGYKTRMVKTRESGNDYRF